MKRLGVMRTRIQVRRRFAELTIVTCALATVMPANAIPAKLSEMVFFAPNSAELRDMEKVKLRNTIPTIRQFVRPCQNVRVVGHLDIAESKRGRAGTLDRLRATRVRDGLRELGLTDLLVDTFASGGNSLLALNAPDDEPQNRRVEILWDCGRYWPLRN